MKDWLDGAAFLEWLESSYAFSAEPHGPAIKRRVSEWRRGSAVTVWRADSLLTAMGLHLSMVPDHVWLAADGVKKRSRAAPVPLAYSPDVRQLAVQKRLAGSSLKELETEFGTSRRTINRWMQEQRQKVEH